MFLDQFSANAFADLVLHSSPLWPAMNNADLVMQKCQTTANSLKLGTSFCGYSPLKNDDFMTSFPETPDGLFF